MHCLVAGGAGFIGSHLCEKLLAMRHRVTCLDNFKTGRLANLKTFAQHPRFAVIRADVRRPISGEYDCIFNLASYASPPYYQAWSIDTMMSNSLGSYHVLENARKNRSLYLLASTSEVYGDPLHHPQREQDWGNVNPVGERACYDEAKRFAEALTMEYVRKHKLNVRIIRIFNTYGPRLQLDDGRVISNFINQILHGRPLTIFGKGLQTRSFCYVDDLVAGIIRAAFAPATRGEIFNLGNPKEFTMLEAAELIQELSGKKARLVFKPLPADDPRRRRPDIAKARRVLGWEPKIALRQGLLMTLNWYRDRGRKGA